MKRSEGEAYRVQAAAGFSILESLIALLVLLVISLGVLPLFSQAVSNNAVGDSYMEATNMARTSLEEYRQLPFDSTRLTVPDGETEVAFNEYFSFADREWKDGAPPTDDPAMWLRTVTVRQFNTNDRKDNQEFDTPMPGGSAEETVHLKSIEVSVESAQEGGVFGRNARRVTLSFLKSF